MTLTADEVYAAAPFVRTLGVELERIAPEAVVGRLPFAPGLSTVGGGLHGGALMGLADGVAAVCAAANGEPGALPATAESTTHFLRPVRGAATATATPVAATGTQVLVEVRVTDGSGELCAHVLQTVRLVRPR
ncbi:PaaI family thioesterase [Promicromonospora thailandica]|uniref:Domain 1-containing protein n=1 Tax=Promicromonospora thailandica TaxID=765201 RepID=A0A9X2G2M0_9MICO|nr:PaaI family thioesterase [Promicromonospora thailandica]MCP2264563.1 putative domain 1-containing protein [Promicromonospora thailandica]BFF20369.1 PaaI family thioesterase [Promicromonospora thailandica]